MKQTHLLPPASDEGGRRLKALPLLWIVACLFLSCAHKETEYALLRQADSLMWASPDSALALLKRASGRQWPTQADSVYYALLLAEAKDKNYIPQTSDSLIGQVAAYYVDQGDVHRQARAYYQWGNVHRNANRQAEALDKYLTASRLASKSKDLRLLTRIYGNAAFLFYLQDLYAEADSLYGKAMEAGFSLGDSAVVSDAFSMCGLMDFEQGSLSSAEQNSLQAVRWSVQGSGSRVILIRAFSTLSRLYAQRGETDRALHYARRHLALQRSSSLAEHRSCLLLGNAYYYAGALDSAKAFFRKSLHSPHKIVKARSFQRLAQIAMLEDDTTEAYRLQHLSSSFQAPEKRVIKRTLTLQDVAHRHQRIMQEECHENDLSCLFLVVGLFICGSGFYVWMCFRKLWREKKRKADEVQCLTERLADEKQQRERENKESEDQLRRLDGQRMHALECVKKQSSVMKKIEDLLENRSKTGLNDGDWIELGVLVDEAGIVSSLSSRYDLTVGETRYCYLLLAGDYTNVELGKLLQTSRQTVHRWEHKILERLGGPNEAGRLRPLLLERAKRGQIG